MNDMSKKPTSGRSIPCADETRPFTQFICPRCGKRMSYDVLNSMYKVCRRCYYTDPEIVKQRREAKAAIDKEIEAKYRKEMGDEAYEKMMQESRRGRK